jgi:glycosyltransferase involved in cell wall biosynthesis
VAYDTGIHREYLGEWGTYAPKGDVAALADAIRLLLENPDLRKERGDKLCARAQERFSWENAGKKIETLYFQLTNRQRLI